MKRIKLIVNPTSGRGRARRTLVHLTDALRHRGFVTEVCLTRRAGDARQAAAQAGGGVDCLLAIGGDGTLNEVVSGNFAQRIPIAVAPTGTANILVRELGLPWRVAELVRLLEDPQPFWVDALRTLQPGRPDAPERYTLAVASAGFDADVVHEFAAARAGSIHMTQYVLPVVRKLARYQAPSIEVEVDGEVVERHATMVVLGNCRNYGGHFELTYDADPADGRVDVCVLTGRRRLDLLRYLVASVLRRIRHCGDHLYFRARRVAVRGPADRPFQIDGDPGGFLPAQFEMMTHSVPLLGLR